MTWLLPTLVLIPLLAGIGMPLIPRGQDGMVKGLSLLVTLTVFLLSLCTLSGFDFENAGAVQLAGSINWIEALNVNFAYGVDSISLWLLLLTTFLMPITVLGSFSAVSDRTREFFAWLLILEAAMIGVFVATDVIFFFICFELTLIPMFFLIGIFGGPMRRWAAQKFFLFTLAGSVFTFAGILYVAWYNFANTGEWTFSVAALTAAAQSMPASQQAWILAALLAGFAVKVPLFPVHTWLPLAHTEAPTAGSVILAGVLLKLGTYGLVRFAIPMAPEAVITFAPCIAGISIIGIIYAALICWVQEDIKKLVAYSSISHLGFCVLGMFALNHEGIGGSVAYMINHGLSTGALFLCVGMIYERYHTREMARLSGLGKRMPIWACFMVFFCMASVGLPGLNGFVGEFLTIFGAFKAKMVLGFWYAAFAAVGMILAAIYILYMVGKVVMGPVKEPAEYAGKVSDLNFREIVTLVPLAVACLVLGLYPSPMLESFDPAIDRLTVRTDAILREMAEEVELVDTQSVIPMAATDIDSEATR